MAHILLYPMYLINLFMLLFFLSTNTWAQKQNLSQKEHQAIQNFMNYANEAVFAANEMYHEFCSMNELLMKYVADSTTKIHYSYQPILTDQKIFKVLPRMLYEKSIADNSFIEPSKRGIPLQLIGKIKNVVDELDLNRKKMSDYFIKAEYSTDHHLTKAFKVLRRSEVLFYDLFTLQEKIHWSQTSLNNEHLISHAAGVISMTDKLQNLITNCKLIIKSIRVANNLQSIVQYQMKLKNSIDEVYTLKQLILKDENNPLSSKQLSLIEEMLEQSGAISYQCENYLGKKNYNSLYFEPAHYYYNNEILTAYNKKFKGLTYCFNQFIKLTDIFWVYEHELPHLFAVKYPDFPEYDAFKKIDIDIDALIKKATQKQTQKTDSTNLAVIDTTNRDTLVNVIKKPQIGDKDLSGFATNNLVFLLDISASMEDTNKLPLLKNALGQLLDLMRKEDNITIITYADKARLRLEPTSAFYKEKIMETINAIKSSGISDANQGLELAYEILNEHLIKGGNNRIILATDGGIDIKNSIKRKVRKYTKSEWDIILSVFYFSDKEYSHHKTLLEELARLGNGKYSFVQKTNADQTLLREAQSVRR